MSFYGSDHILEDLSGLTPRAVEFLRNYATREDFNGESHGVTNSVDKAAAFFDLQENEVALKVSRIQERFGGLKYRSPSWSFDEVIIFAPTLDFDEDDDEPLLSLIEHTVAHPFGVWVNLDGNVFFMYPDLHGGEYVKVFDRIEDLIESDAIFAECSSNWSNVGAGGADLLESIKEKCKVLSRLSEGVGETEAWWYGDDIRVLVWETWARVFNREELSRWAIWSSSTRGQEVARIFLL